MSKAPTLTGLAAFTRKQQPAQPQPGAAVVPAVPAAAPAPAPERRKARGESDTVAMTVRLSRADWERLHQLAVSERTSIQRLAIDGFSKVFESKGLPGMTS